MGRGLPCTADEQRGFRLAFNDRYKDKAWKAYSPGSGHNVDRSSSVDIVPAHDAILVDGETPFIRMLVGTDVKIYAILEQEICDVMK